MAITERTLDWRSRHDPRSKDYPVRGLVPASPRRRLWTPGQVIVDQGREGACTGFAAVTEAMASPVRVDITRVAKAPALGVPTTHPNAFAQKVYRLAQKIDEWPGENYEGSSVLAATKVMQQLGLIGEYRWAFSIDDLAVALQRGPAVLGVPWFESMYEPNGQLLRVGGQLAGGHAICCIGFDPTSEHAGGRAAFALCNSWSAAWGKNGVAWIAADDLARLLRQDGEAMVPWRRSYGLAA